MGLVIHLSVNPSQISPDLWEQTYQESLWVLHEFPLPLMMMKREEWHGMNRWTYKRNLIQNEGEPNEHWQVCGDLISGKRAESFSLYRHLSREFPSPSEWNEKDILWIDPEDIDRECNGGYVFQNKTQGYPYHLALLAVGILFESRFPYSVHLNGDIDRYQIEMMVQWLNTILDTPVNLPACVDGQTLYKRLRALHPPDLAIPCFEELYRDNPEDMLTKLFEYAAREDVIAYVQATLLSDYSALNQMGSSSLVSRFLSVTQDLDETIAMVQGVQSSHEEPQEFSLEALLKMLCAHFITIEDQERAVLSTFSSPADRLLNIQDTFAQVFMVMAGMPTDIGYSMERTELLDIFAGYAPEKRALFADIIAEAEKECRETLDKTRELIAQHSESGQSESDGEEDSADNDADETEDIPYPVQESGLSPSVAYIMQQAYRQREALDVSEKMVKFAGEQIQDAIQARAEMFESTEKSDYIRGICRNSEKSYFALEEQTWTKIEQVERLDIMKALFVLSLLARGDAYFKRLSIYIFEHSPLWPCLIPESGARLLEE